jgi:hypothetical protein
MRAEPTRPRCLGPRFAGLLRATAALSLLLSTHGCAPSCGEGTRASGGVCEGDARMWVRVPLPAGTPIVIGQGMHGPLSHQGADAHALDFAGPEGTPVSAARDGVVVARRSDSTTGCGMPGCAGDANYVVVDHGDATFGRYWHLMPGGVDVEVGDVVCAGEPLGRMGQTGYAVGPHLHFDVVDPLGTTRPLAFEGLDPGVDGWLWEGAGGASSSVAPGFCEASTLPSTCPEGLFGFLGVPRLEGAPCGIAARDQDHWVQGTAPGASRAALSRYSDVRGEWIHECTAVAPDGSFRMPLRWPSAEHGRVTRYLIAPATESGPCRPTASSGVSVTLHLR